MIIRKNQLLLWVMVGLMVSPLLPVSRAVAQQVAATEIAAMNETTMSAEQQSSHYAYQAQDQRLSAELRSQALRELRTLPSQNALVAVARGLKDEDPSVRIAAIDGSEPYSIANRWRMVAPLIDDENSSVRSAAAANLVRDYLALAPQHQQRLDPEIALLIESLVAQQSPKSQQYVADIWRWTGEYQQAEQGYLDLLESDANGSLLSNSDLWLGLADNYRAQQKDQLALAALDKGIAAMPEDAALRYAKALTLVRLDQKSAAAEQMQQAALMAEDNSYYWYLNGVLQEPFDAPNAVQSFETAYMISGAPEQLFAVCDVYQRQGDPRFESCLTELAEVAPAQVVESLREKASLN